MAAAGAGLLALLTPGLAHAAEPVTTRTLQTSFGLVLGGGDDDDMWGTGLGASVGYTFAKPMYLGIAFDGFNHLDRDSTFWEALVQGGYDFASGDDPQLILRPTLGLGYAHLAEKSHPKNGIVLAPGVTFILSAGLLFSLDVRYDLVFLGSQTRQGGVMALGIGVRF